MDQFKFAGSKPLAICSDPPVYFLKNQQKGLFAVFKPFSLGKKMLMKKKLLQSFQTLNSA